MTPPAAPSPALHLKYRPDIDGLRAVAVLSVLGFHAFPRWVPGGFIGVDVFFAISGYLITTILLGNLASGSFGWRDFYARRVRRIFPALLVVMAATLAFGWWVLLPGEFRQLGRHLVAGAGFVSNVAFWSESGYFDTAAESKPLLHLWSLAVEEQFYIVWPPVLALAWRRGWSLPRVLAALALASFVVNVALLHRHPAATFYLPAARIWELAAGGLLAWARLRRPHAMARGASLMGAAGLALLALGLALIDPRRAFPGGWALLPVAGALLCMAAGPAAWTNRRLLAARPMVWFGLISYPLYLWHWPLLSFARIVEGDTPSRGLRAAAALGAVALAWLTWRFVEQAVRRGAGRATAGALALAMAGVATLGGLAAAGRPAPRHDDPFIDSVATAMADWSYPAGLAPVERAGVPLWRIGAGARRVLLLGDSHIEQYGARAVALARSAPATLDTVYFAATGGCPPVPHVFEDRNAACDARRNAFIALARSDAIDAVVVGACWNCYFIDQARVEPGVAPRDDFYFRGADGIRHGFRTGDGVERSLQSLEALLKELAGRKQVYLLLDNPTGPDFGPERLIAGSRLGRLHARRLTPTAAQPEAQQRWHERLRALAERSGAAVIDPLPSLCRDGQCLRALPDGTPIYKDADHLRSAYVGSYATWLDAALTTTPP